MQNVTQEAHHLTSGPVVPVLHENGVGPTHLGLAIDQMDGVGIGIRAIIQLIGARKADKISRENTYCSPHTQMR